MEVFIKAVQQNPCLWNVLNKDYRNQEIKDEAWQSIVDMKLLRLRGVKEAKAEWKKLRDNHRDSLKRVKANKSGQLKNSWKYAHCMEFLLPFMKSRKRSSNLIIDVSPHYLEMQDDDSNEMSTPTNETNDATEIERVEAIGARKRKADSELDFTEEPLSIYQKRIEDKEVRSSQIEKHAIDLFLESMAITIKSMPAWMQTRVKRKIFAIVSEAEDGLDNASSVKQQIQ